VAKAVFRPGELVSVAETVTLTPPEFLEFSQAPETEEVETEPEVEQYTGPTAEDLRREAEEFKAHWDTEREAMIQNANDQAEDIVNRARETASAELHRKEMEATDLTSRAHEEADRIVADAKKQAEDLGIEARKAIEEERKTALEEGREAGRLESYADGKVEVERLIQRTQVVLERAQDKRGEILTETEQEIINLVLLITRKVVKVIADNQREVIVSNVIQALRKVRDRGTVIIRVNLADLKLTTEHTKDFIQMLEGVKSIQVVEDSTVDSGGCIIETDFGEIDARIASQLGELEAKILEVSPIKTTAKEKKESTKSTGTL
jgi:flagellar assembly protein FliH